MTTKQVEQTAKRMRNRWHKSNIGSLKNTLFEGQWLRLARWHLAAIEKAKEPKRVRGKSV